MTRRVGTFVLQGTVDIARLGRIAPAEVRIETLDDCQTVTLPGFQCRWLIGRADFAVDEDILVLATGRTATAATLIERYRRRGTDAADEIDGGFAAVIVDARAHRALLLVDRFAMETLCYAGSGGHVAFSDMATAVPGATGTVDPQALYDYLVLHVIASPATVFRDVRRVEAGHCVEVERAGVSSKRYWKPQFVEDDHADLADRARRFRQLVEASVADEAGEGPVACFLSGGTDSSTIAGMLRRLRRAPVHAYSIGFDAQGYDEMAYARIAARHFDLVHHEYYITADDLVAAIPKVAASYDQPFGNSSVLPAYYCALRACEDGFSRILAGDGGDELFGGNARYAMQALLGLYARMPRAARAGLLETVASFGALRRVPGLRQLTGYVRHASVPMPERMHTFDQVTALREYPWLGPAFDAVVDPAHVAVQRRATWDATPPGSELNRMLAYDWKYTLADTDLPKVRGATRLAGIDVRYPMLSRPLTDFSLSLPPDWKVNRWRLRWFFKRALRGFLPNPILRKRKHGFGLPFGPWLTSHRALRDLAEDSLRGAVRRGFVRDAFVTELLADRLTAAPGYYGELVWILMMMEQWLRAHADAYAIAERAAPPPASLVDAS